MGATLHEIQSVDDRRVVLQEFVSAVSEADLARTYDVTDKMLKQEIRRATGKNIKDGLLKENGLMTVRRMLVRVAEDTETVGEAVPVLMEHIENARKGRYLYSWALVAKPLAAQLKMAA